MKPLANTGILFIFALANSGQSAIIELKGKSRAFDKEYHMNKVHDILKQFCHLVGYIFS